MSFPVGSSAMRKLGPNGCLGCYRAESGYAGRLVGAARAIQRSALRRPMARAPALRARPPSTTTGAMRSGSPPARVRPASLYRPGSQHRGTRPGRRHRSRDLGRADCAGRLRLAGRWASAPSSPVWPARRRPRDSAERVAPAAFHLACEGGLRMLRSQPSQPRPPLGVTRRITPGWLGEADADAAIRARRDRTA
jgi:hypothetical protein